MHGVLIVHKPQEFTSFDVVAKLRGICGTRKIGHSGTLDPMATGVLCVFVGNATKAADLQQNHDKTYLATMRLGMRTDTGDIWGTVLESAPVPETITLAAVRAAAQTFVGELSQLPPMYSAVKVNGQPLYKAAREGKTVERTARPVTIYRICVIDSPAPNEFTLEIACSKGTYVRTLLEDIGGALGVPATMSALVRTQAGEYTLSQAYTLAQLQQAKDNGTLEELLLGVDTVFSQLPPLEVDSATRKRLQNGAKTYRCAAADGHYRAYHAGEFIGTCFVEGNTLSIGKLFAERE